MALTDKDSFWKGAAVYDNYTNDYGSGGKTVYDVGQVNLYLQNEAQWINEKQSHGTTTTVNSAAWTGSILANLYGGSDTVHRGYIYQKDNTPISVLNYSGHTLVYYDHDGEGTAAENFSAGDFRIKNALEGSSITLRTNSANTSDEAVLGKILEVLANKLYYMGYTEGDTKLKGTVEIAEGLTASSASMDGNIAFRTDTDTEKNGQGTYAYVPAIVEILDGPITKDRTLTADSKVLVNAKHVSSIGVSAVYNGDDSVVVDMVNHGLRLEAASDTNGKVAGIQTASGTEANKKSISFINMEKSKPLVISAIHTNGTEADGIYVAENSKVSVNGDVVIEKVTTTGRKVYGVANRGPNAELTINGGLKISGSGDDGWDALKADKDTNGINTVAIANIANDGKLTVSGPVDVKVKGIAVNSTAKNGILRLAAAGF